MGMRAATGSWDDVCLRETGQEKQTGGRVKGKSFTQRAPLQMAAAQWMATRGGSSRIKRERRLNFKGYALGCCPRFKRSNRAQQPGRSQGVTTPPGRFFFLSTATHQATRTRPS